MANTLSWTSENDVKVHTIDTDRRVVLQAQIDMFGKTEAKMSHLTEARFGQFVFLDFKATFQNF